MSVLESIKGTFHNVQEDIKNSLRSLTSREKLPPGDATGSSSEPINVDAGADLLNRFQQCWIEIHQRSEGNAAAAEEADDVASTVFIQHGKECKQLGQLREEVQNLPSLASDLQRIAQHLVSLDELVVKVEMALIELEDICEVQEMEKDKESHKQQLAKYQERKRAELEHTKVKMAQEHAAKAKASEQRKMAKLKDRQEAFEEAFVSDVEHYKRTGRTERISSVGSDPMVDIADIDVGDTEADQGALDAFLDDEISEATNQSPDQAIKEELESAMNEEDEEADTVPAVEVKLDEDLASDSEVLEKSTDLEPLPDAVNNKVPSAEVAADTKSPSESSDGWECVNGVKSENSSSPS